jgi:hypothetical protein
MLLKELAQQVDAHGVSHHLPFLEYGVLSKINLLNVMRKESSEERVGLVLT